MKKSIVLVGGGPASLKAAYDLSPFCDVTIYEKEKTIGQKFLVAGKGGFNLTNAADHEILLSKYSPKDFLTDSLTNFNSESTRNWLNELGISTFVGSGNKVLADKEIWPSTVLNKIKDYFQKNNVTIFTQSKFISFSNDSIIVEIDGLETNVTADYYIFGLGGASWRKTGSDGLWTSAFNNIEIKTNPFLPSNCGVNIKWDKEFRNNHSGKPLKNITVSSEEYSHRGEVTITDYGLEGNAIYPIVPGIRKQLSLENNSTIKVDLKPDSSIEQLFEKIFNISSHKNYAKVLNLNRTQMALLKVYTSKEEFLNPELFVQKIKELEIPVTSLRPIDEAISTIGGIDVNELNSNFSLKKQLNIFTIGEMVDWDAPTGGFLLQGCFSMGALAAKSIVKSTEVESII